MKFGTQAFLWIIFCFNLTNIVIEETQLHWHLQAIKNRHQNVFKDYNQSKLDLVLLDIESQKRQKRKFDKDKSLFIRFERINRKMRHFSLPKKTPIV